MDKPDETHLPRNCFCSLKCFIVCCDLFFSQNVFPSLFEKKGERYTNFMMSYKVEAPPSVKVGRFKRLWEQSYNLSQSHGGSPGWYALGIAHKKVNITAECLNGVHPIHMSVCIAAWTAGRRLNCIDHPCLSQI